MSGGLLRIAAALACSMAIATTLAIALSDCKDAAAPVTDAEAGVTIVIPCPGAVVFVVDAAVPQGPGK